jgi:CrcB protein
MQGIFSIFIGAGIGGVLRYLMIELVKRLNPAPFPMGTLLVNVLGSLLMGALMAWVLRDAAARESARLLLATGVLGGFTTFSAFAWDVLFLWQRGAVVPALTYVAGSLFLSLIAVAVGYIIVMKAGIV